jgi:hypothetical protein
MIPYDDNDKRLSNKLLYETMKYVVLAGTVASSSICSHLCHRLYAGKQQSQTTSMTICPPSYQNPRNTYLPMAVHQQLQQHLLEMTQQLVQQRVQLVPRVVHVVGWQLVA